MAPTEPLGGSFGIPTLGRARTGDKGWVVAYSYRWQQEVADRTSRFRGRRGQGAALADGAGFAGADGAGFDGDGNGVGRAIGGSVAIGPFPAG
jgi:hypothetical protein